MKVNFNIKGENGSIAVFVLVGMLFMSSFLILAFGANANKSKISAEQFDIISKIYSHQDGDANAYERAYTALRRKNAQILTSSVDNNLEIELTKTFKDKVNNYRIYGAEEGVGDMANIFDVDNFIETYSPYQPTKPEIVQFEGEECLKIYGETTVDGRDFEYMKGQFKENTQYTFSLDLYDVKSKDTYGIFINIYYTDSSVASLLSAIRSGEKEWKHLIYKSEKDKTISHIKITYGTRQAYTYFKNIKIEEGNYQADYVSYGIYKIPIMVKNDKENKNLFDINYPRIAKIINTAVENIDNGFKYTSQTNVKWASYISYALDFDAISGKTITCSANFKLSEENKASMRIGYWNNDKFVYGENIISISQNGKYELTATIPNELPSDAISSYAIFFNITNLENMMGATLEVRDIQVEIGDKSTDYEDKNIILRNIYIDSPLKQNEYIDFKSKKIVRNDGTEEFVELPEILTFEDYTKIEVLTEVKPSRIEIEYFGYKFE